MTDKIYALVDCNNFFVSCERLFDPKSWNKPAMVLSNNDGCVVARSQEVKDLGIPMGVPLFKVKDIVKIHNIKVYSCNFQLYGDISDRIMNTLYDYSPSVEVYSIDEAFLNLSHLKLSQDASYKDLGNNIIKTIRKNLGVPVSVGIAPTKTLAKLANELAKLYRKFNTTFDLTQLSTEELDSELQKIPIGEVWGIGWNRTILLNAHGIYNVKDFKHADRLWVKKHLSIQGERTQLELHGIACFDFESSPKPKKGIASTRSFGRDVTSIKELRESVSTHASNVARKLREQNSICSYVTVHIKTNKHKEYIEQYSNAVNVLIPEATDDTSVIIKYALKGLNQIFKTGYHYKKVGVYVTGIRRKGDYQMTFDSSSTKPKDSNLMESIDRINQKYGDYKVRYAVQGFRPTWKVKREMFSKRFTTDWNELLEVNLD